MNPMHLLYGALVQSHKETQTLFNIISIYLCFYKPYPCYGLQCGAKVRQRPRMVGGELAG